MESTEVYNFARFNTWANDRIAHFLSKQKEERMFEFVGSSFPSIQKTVYHIHDAETAWMNRINQIQNPKWPFGHENANFSDSLEKWKISYTGFEEYVLNTPSDGLRKMIHYSDSRGNKYTNVLLDIIMHLINHTTYHRGQIVTQIRNLGITDRMAPMDFIYYLRKG